jgi:hypothetical protein
MNNNFEIIDLQKMIFIYNALQKGWSVKKIKDDKFEFKKTKNAEVLDLDQYMKDFISTNLNIDNLIKKK